MVNARGFTFVEIMVSVAVLGCLGLASMEVSKLLGDASTHLDHAQAAQALVFTIGERLKHSDLCSAAVGTSSGLNQGTIDRTALLAGTQEIQVAIAGLKAGLLANENIVKKDQIFALQKLKLEHFRFEDAVLVAPDTYVANVALHPVTLTQRKLRPLLAGSLHFKLSGPTTGSSITDCTGTPSAVSMDSCASLNCEWIASATPQCTCKRPTFLCPTGQYPVATTGTTTTCKSLGGAPCAPTKYLSGVKLGENICGDLTP